MTTIIGLRECRNELVYNHWPAVGRNELVHSLIFLVNWGVCRVYEDPGVLCISGVTFVLIV